MITLKSGVPGSGKTLSMVHELLVSSKGPNVRALYTNITDLALPHVELKDATKWRECPPGSLIVIDEAFLHGYESKSTQAAVPEYIRDLAVHRKDYSVDLVFIAQHPKLLHVALRRQVGKHQHYRRLFGWGRSVVYEWDMCQENLTQTKTAVTSNFTFPKSAFAAYKSAEVHTKPKFKLPWWAWLPLLIIPAAVWAFPAAFATLSGAMTGKGIPHSDAVLNPFSSKPVSVTVTNPVVTSGAPSAVAVPVAAPAVAVVPDEPPAGCIATASRCACFDVDGASVTVKPGVCESVAGVGRPKTIQFEDSPPPVRPLDDADRAVLSFVFNSDKQRVSSVPR